MRTMNASEFKAKCLAVLDEVQKTGEQVTILKRGKPVALLAPVPPIRYPQDDMIGTVTILGDIMSPTVDDADILLDLNNLEPPR